MISQATFARYASDPTTFRNDLIVDVDGIARKLGDVLDVWQREDFAALDAGMMRCNGRSPENSTAKMRAYLERPRGHSKTTDIAVVCCWALAFAVRPIRGYAFAADRDQAGLLKDAMATIVRLNPWLAGILDVQKNLVLNVGAKHPGEGGKLEIFTSDVASSFGILPDLLVADELTHWQGDGSLWHSLISSAAKRSNCLLLTITNAGFADSWQWAVRETARIDEAWIFSRLDGPRASWMNEARLAEQRRMLPAIAFARLWENQWSSGGGDALTPEVIAAAFRSEMCPQLGAEHGIAYVGGLDLGISRDASALCILGVRRKHDGHGTIRLALTKTWRPTKGEKVNLSDVEAYIAETHGRFDLKTLNYDPWQAQHLASRLQAGGLSVFRSQLGRLAGTTRVPMVELTQSGPNLQRMASTLIESFNDRRIELFEDAELRRDLTKFRIEERSYGFRLVSPKDSNGHGDLGSAFAMALLAAAELAAKRIVTAGTGEAPGRTPLERELAFQARRAESIRKEMDWAARHYGSENHEAMKRAMREQSGPSPRLG